MTEQGRVLIVEDQEAIGHLYQRWLDDTYDVTAVTSGEAALDVLGNGGFDVVLLDRMMPGISGDEVLRTLREEGFDCRVAMVSAVDPDFDIIAMGIDAYIPKPPTKEQLRTAVRDLLDRGTYESDLRELVALASKRAALRAEKTEQERAENPAFEDLERRIAELTARLETEEALLLDDMTFIALLRDIEGTNDE